MTEVQTDDQMQQGEPRAAKKPKGSGGFDSLALRELRRARRLIKDGEPTPEATFAVSTANVLALLDLASAIRDQTGSQNGT